MEFVQHYPDQEPAPEHQPQPNPQAPTPEPPKRTPAEASRENGRKGKGPITAEGKRRSALNACNHMFTAKHCGYSNQILPGISRIHRALKAEFNPTTPSEATLIDEMALARWQMQSSAEEYAALVNHTRGQFFDDPRKLPQLNNALATDQLHKESNTLANYQRYRRDAERRFSRCVRELLFIRQHTGILHSGASLIPAEREEDLAQIAAEAAEAAETVAQPAPVAPPQAPPAAENTISPNEPGHLVETKASSPDDEHSESSLHGLPQSSKANDPSKSADQDGPPYSDEIDPFVLFATINKEIYKFPEVYSAVCSAVQKLEADRQADPVKFRQFERRIKCQSF